MHDAEQYFHDDESGGDGRPVLQLGRTGRGHPPSPVRRQVRRRRWTSGPHRAGAPPEARAPLPPWTRGRREKCSLSKSILLLPWDSVHHNQNLTLLPVWRAAKLALLVNVE